VLDGVMEHCMESWRPGVVDLDRRVWNINVPCASPQETTEPRNYLLAVFP
jgi:hypothetical protein